MVDRRTVLGAMLAGVCAPLAGAVKTEWIDLLHSASLEGWKKEGHADWKMENGVLVGRPGPGGTAGDLFTEKLWADFDLESEWKMKWPGNSGIWFRVNGENTGYQADILQDAGAKSGSLYCMGKAFIGVNGDGATVNENDWNRTRILAVGDDLRVDQNGKTVVQVRDHSFPGPGSIGIQVHTGEAFKDMEIRVRVLRVKPVKRSA